MTLSEIALLPHFAGASLQRLVSRTEAGFDFVHVRLVKPLEPLSPDAKHLDLSKAAYFGLGTVKRV